MEIVRDAATSHVYYGEHAALFDIQLLKLLKTIHLVSKEIDHWAFLLFQALSNIDELFIFFVLTQGIKRLLQYVSVALAFKHQSTNGHSLQIFAPLNSHSHYSHTLSKQLMSLEF